MKTYKTQKVNNGNEKKLNKKTQNKIIKKIVNRIYIYTYKCNK